MSFDIDNFSPLGGQARRGNSPAEWSYSSLIDDLATVLAPGYFDEVGIQVSSGDFINVSLSDGKAIITVDSITLSPPAVTIDTEVIGGSGAFPVENFTDTTKILTVVDNEKFIVMNNAETQTVIIPDDASEAFSIGAEMEFLREGVGAVNFVVAGVAVLESRDDLSSINSLYSAVTLKKIASNEWRLIGDLAAGIFSPTHLADLLTWHDASDITSILEADNPGFVSALLDKSGNANDHVQATTADQPTTGVETINSLNAIGFDGVDDALTKASLTLSPSITLFMVVNVVSVANVFDSIVAFGNTSLADFEVDAGIFSSQFRAKFESAGLGHFISPESPVNLLGQDILVVYRLAADEGNINLRINGVFIAGDTYNGALSAVLDYHIGRNRNNAQFTEMNMGEYLIYDRDLHFSEISVIENRLKLKWGIA